MNHNLIDKKHKTPLGIVNCRLTSNQSVIELIENKTYEKGKSEIYKSTDFHIELIEFKIKTPLHNGDLTDSNSWIWRIIRQQNNSENIQLVCKLSNQNNDVEFDTATGEHLDAIEASNKDWILHIGTEDGEIMNSRAETNDWFPKRLKNNVNFYQSITEMNKNGFVTKIPDLQIDERLYIHYICAYNKRSDDKNKLNTWFAVD